MKRFIANLLVVAIYAFLSAGETCAQPPDNYYRDAIGKTGEALKTALHEIISGQNAKSYAAARDGVCLLDEDPANADNVILIYSRLSVAKTSWPAFNREHLWPQSLGAKWYPAKSDMHHIFAANARVNSSRSNKWFDNSEDNPDHHELALLASYDDDSWQVPDSVRGDVARALLYMDVRYEGGDDEPDLKLVDDEVPTTGCNCMGRLSTLLEWHLADPVDDRERHRNNLIYTDIQGNRNPFIDHPEWVFLIWDEPELPNPEPTPETITVCSFNIQFLGSFRQRDNAALASILRGYDVVVIQELVAPPYEGTFPDSTAFRPDPEAAAFFDEMDALGFAWVLSEEDTGRGADNHYNSTATEWWVAFYDPDSVSVAGDLPGGFLAEDRTQNPDFDRVPYAFPFRSVDGDLDFVLISVHLAPGRGESERRLHELDSINDWISAQSGTERDYIILGDMNIEDEEELQQVVPGLFHSLNEECVPTNTNVNGPRPYDHVMYVPEYTTEIDEGYGFEVVNLISAMRPFWNEDGVYPGEGEYRHDAFRYRYSDHHPVDLRLRLVGEDDD